MKKKTVKGLPLDINAIGRSVLPAGESCQAKRITIFSTACVYV
jgi:hypothetical protein